MQDPRIVLVVDGLGAGGAEKTVADVAGALTTIGMDTTVIYLQERPNRIGLEACSQRHVSTLFVRITRLWKIREWVAFILSIKRLRPDVLHAHLHYATIVSIVVGALLRIRTVVTLHTLEEPGDWSKAGLRLRLMFILIKYVPCELICLTNQSKAIALKHAPKVSRRIHVIPNGLDLGEWKIERQKEIARDPTSPIVMLSVAVLRKLKGIHHLIHAHAVLSKRFPNLQLWIVGDGPERHRLEQEAELAGSKENVFFTGHRSDIRELMKSADLFVLPTLFDALPTVVIEAMAVGLPIVASRTGGIPEMIKDKETGLLVEPANEGELISACDHLIRHPHLASKLGDAARKSVERNFDLNVQVQRLLSLYELRDSVS